MKRHSCNLPIKDTTGLPKLPPNANYIQKFKRKLRRLLLLSPSHFMCKKMFRNKSAMFAERRRAAQMNSYVIHPFSILSAILECLFFMVWFYYLMVQGIIWIAEKKLVDTLDEYLLAPIHIILIILFFNVGYIDSATNKIILEPRKIISRYLKTFFAFDLCTTYYSVKLVHIIEQNPNVSSYYHFVRLVCLCVRLNTLQKSLRNTLDNLRFGNILATFSVYLLKTYIYIHLLIAPLTGLPILINKRKLPAESWITQAKIYEEDCMIHRYTECFLLATSYFFGISHKLEIKAVSEQVLLVAVTIFGRLYTLFLIADVLRMLGIAGVSESAYERQMMALKQYMVTRGLPESLKQRMLRYCEFKFQGRYFKENRIINNLSDNLRAELFLFTARKLIQKVQLFKKLPSATLVAIITSMTTETFSPGDIIIKIGVEVNEIYFISTGTVAIIGATGKELCHLEDGDTFGISCLTNLDLNVSVLALETTEVFVIKKKQFVEFLSPFPEIMNAFLRSAKARFDEYRRIEDLVNFERNDLLSGLKRGSILEQPTKRYVVK